MNAIAQNNRFGTIAIVEGKRMEFATEDEACEYVEEEDNESNLYIHRRMELRSLLRRTYRARRSKQNSRRL